MEKDDEKKKQLSKHVEKLSEWFEKMKPYLKQIEPFLRRCYPYYVVIDKQARTLYVVLKPYYHPVLNQVLFALVLLFLGGHFAMTIACVQAFKLAGWRLVVKSWAELKESYVVAVGALQKDATAMEIFDSNKDGKLGHMELLLGVKDIAIAETQDEKIRARKKVFLLMKCIDPNKILDATMGIWTGLVAVLATLRSRFVHCIGIGANIGKLFAEALTPFAQPRLHALVPEHTKWVDFGLRTSCGLVGIICSLLLVRVLSAFNSSLQGATLLIRALHPLIAEKRSDLPKLTPEHEQIAVWCIAAIGFMWQLKSGFNLPWLLKVPLMPVYTLEYTLGVLAAF